MKCLIPGQHFGANKKKIHFRDCIFTEAVYMPGISAPWHYHENAYFYYHLQGSLLEVNKKKELICTPGTVLYHSWQDPHYDTDFSTDVRFFHIELSPKWFENFGISSSQIEGSNHLENPLFIEIFRRLYDEVRNPDAVTELAVEGLLLQAYAEMSRYSTRTEISRPGWVNKVREILQDGDITTITLQGLSKETGIHPVHLSREFPTWFQTSFGNYVRKWKLNQAVALLADKQRSIADIAYTCGYSDESHFIRSFKKVYGVSPNRYRKSLS